MIMMMEQVRWRRRAVELHQGGIGQVQDHQSGYHDGDYDGDHEHYRPRIGQVKDHQSGYHDGDYHGDHEQTMDWAGLRCKPLVRSPLFANGDDDGENGDFDGNHERCRSWK